MNYFCAIILAWMYTNISAFSPVVNISHQSSNRPSSKMERAHLDKSIDADSEVDLCIIGAGISGLSAAIEAATVRPDKKIILLESQATPGGRVSSDFTNGFTLDRGYAVFIEEYPESKKMFDYDALGLKPYDPGALIKIKSGFTTVADPLRQPSKIIQALTTKVGNFADKLRLGPLFYHVKTKSVKELFEEEESDTLSCLRNKYKFSDKMIQEFFEPFMVGIYFSPLDQQSSRMFHFVFKMFADGAGTLPTGGMQAVANQLTEKAIKLGIDVQLNQSVREFDEDGSGFRIETKSGTSFNSKSVICATDGTTAEKLVSKLKGFEKLNGEQERRQRSVGCFYYTFSECECPVTDKVLVLNGEGIESGPALTVSFQHLINESYSPEECGLCSVSIPEKYMIQYEGRREDLDLLVRSQLGEWWPDFKDDIENNWHLEKTYHIKCAQPAQFGGAFPANIHGGRIASQVRGIELPPHFYLCGDYMATSTFNGAIESGINAAKAAFLKC